MSSSRSPKKSKRSYSLRNPRSVRSPALQDVSPGFYDRLEELDCSGPHQAEHPRESTDGRLASFSSHLGEPLIAEEPKEERTKRKRRARSLRVTKAESRIFLVESSSYDDLEASTPDQAEAPKPPRKETALCEGARVACGLAADDGQQLIEELGTKDDTTEREKQKSNKMKQYKKTIDRAFRRGWENFMALYTVSISRSAANNADGTPPLVQTC